MRAALEPCTFLGGSALHRAAAHLHPSATCNPSELAVFFESQMMLLRLFATSYSDLYFSMSRAFMYCILRSSHADIVAALACLGHEEPSVICTLARNATHGMTFLVVLS